MSATEILSMEIAADTFLQMQEDLRRMKIDGYDVRGVAPGEAYHASSLILTRYGEFIAECGNFTEAVAYSRGYEAARRAGEWEAPPPSSKGVRRAFIARHESETGFRTRKAVEDWIGAQSYPEGYEVAIMEWESKP